MLIFTLLTACNPQDAVMTDSHWFTWIAANSSNITKNDVLTYMQDDVSQHPEGAPSVHTFECSGRGWNRFQNRWDPGYLGPEDGSNPENITGGNCVCGEEGYPACDALDETTRPVLAECTDIQAAEFYTFLQNDGYYLLSQELESWRTEALINGEGDVQLTVHHALPEGEDFRFHFSIKPNFQPTHCTTDEDGNAKVEYVDGADWLSQWSEDEDGYTIYYLNAGSYQLDPSDATPWYTITDWSAGFGYARFAGEEFTSIATAYGNYDNDEADNFMYASNRSEPDYDAYNATIATLNESSERWEAEMTQTAMASLDGTPYFEHKVEDNLWRPINSTNTGFDGWFEIHSSWVRIKDGATFEVDSPLEGDFQIAYQALESNSRILVRGSFSIEALREDPWAYPILENDKRLENETDFCGGATLGN
ncbi:MAG: hypothetical protein VX278_21430 [Myxococcota bacterium]|nr:hypothetical protein [Myxococcota bacterium]